MLDQSFRQFGLVELDWQKTKISKESIGLLADLIKEDHCQIVSLKMHLEGAVVALHGQTDHAKPDCVLLSPTSCWSSLVVI